MKQSCTRLLLLLLLLVSAGCGGGGEPTRNIDFIPLSSITITSQNPQAAVGTSNRFSAIGIYGDPSTFQFTRDITSQVTWASDNTDVLTFSTPAAAGFATSLVADSVTVTATFDTIHADLPFTVSNATITALAITPPANTNLFAGQTLQLRATGTFSDGSNQDLTETAFWSSSDPTVATVDTTVPGSGLVKGLVMGTTDITAEFDTQSDTLTLDVAAATLASIAVTPVGGSSKLALGTTMQLLATGTYTDGSAVDLTSDVTWASSNTAVATIDQDAATNGKLSSVTAGATTVTASLSGVTSPGIQVTVSLATLDSQVISPANPPTLAVGQDLALSVSGDFSDNSSQDLTSDVLWKSSNNSIATVSNSIGAEGTVKGIDIGTATITAESNGIPTTPGFVTDSVEVTVQ